jgi:hypothetical protein
MSDHRKNGANWTLGFVDYGEADAMECNQGLATAVEELQHQFDAEE